MKGEWKVNGIRWNENGMIKKKLRVLVTEDAHGCTVSIGDEEDGTMFSVPFDEIVKELRRRKK